MKRFIPCVFFLNASLFVKSICIALLNKFLINFRICMFAHLPVSRFVAMNCLLTFKRIILYEPYLLVVLLIIISQLSLGEIIEKVGHQLGSFLPFLRFVIQNY